MRNRKPNFYCVSCVKRIYGWLFVLLICILPVDLVEAMPELSEFHIGGSSSTIFAAGAYGLAEAMPLFTVKVDEGRFSFELKTQARLFFSTAPLNNKIELDESYIKTWIGSWSYVKAGYYRLGTTAAEFFPQTQFFGSLDPLSYLERGANSGFRNNELLFETSFFLGLFRAALRLAPFAPALVLPSLSSPWFILRDIPQSATIGGSAYKMASINYETNPHEQTFSLAPAFNASLGFSGDSFDTDIHYFHGLERQAILSPLISEMPSADHYDLLLRSSRSINDTLAISSTYVIEAFRFWLESSFCFGASYASGTIDFSGIFLDPKSFKVSSTAPIISSERLGITVGASWRRNLGGLIMTLFSEGTWTEYFLENPSSTIAKKNPYLSKAIATGFSMTTQDEEIGLSCFSLISLEDGSFALKPSLKRNFGDSASLELSLLHFFGESESELGGFTKNQQFFIIFTHHF